MERESIEFDIVIVGGGPAGLAAAIRLKQLAIENKTEVSICIIEKGVEIGAHIMSGAIMDPSALNELFPDWQARGAPVTTAVTEAQLLFLTQDKALRIPGILLPGCFANEGNYIVQLGALTKWFGEQAEALGVELFPGFAGVSVLYDEQGSVKGVLTGDLGINRDGTHKANFQPGMELHAKYTVFAEGCRGNLGKELETRFMLRAGVDPQTYNLGIKELWEIPAANHQPGLAIHTVGWPVKSDTYGGGSLYHLGDNLLSVCYAVGLNYTNPHLSPFEEFQRYKAHKAISHYFKGGKRLTYGARTLTSGGLQSLPGLIFPGGALIGDDAGFLHAARLKGIHCAIKSGMLVANAAFEALSAGRQRDELNQYPAQFRNSWLHKELYKTRNFKPYMCYGFWLGSLLFGAEQKLFGGHIPWTLHNTADHDKLRPANEMPPIAYPKPDGVLTFDRLSSVFLSNTHHEEMQPCNLQLADSTLAITVNLSRYDSPEQRYCPGGVYEIIRDGVDGIPYLQINAQNCLHCKTCDIKDPCQNIKWVPPQGGEGPIYQGM